MFGFWPPGDEHGALEVGRSCDGIDDVVDADMGVGINAVCVEVGGVASMASTVVAKRKVEELVSKVVSGVLDPPCSHGSSSLRPALVELKPIAGAERCLGGGSAVMVLTEIRVVDFPIAR